MPTVSVNGIDCYYERSGSGPPLLFVNGSGSTLETSAMLVKPFTERFDVVAHDQRGLGRTSIPEGPYTMADYAADAAALLDAVGWDTARVVGISFGGMVAQELAVTWPERIERLALLCTSPGGVGGSSFPLHTLAALPPEERASKAAELLDTRFTPEWLAEHPGDQALVDFLARREEGTSDDPDVQRGMTEQLHARAGHDVSDRLGAVTCPTLVACGRYDGIAPSANGKEIASRIAGAELREFEGGHAFMVQDPEAYPAIIEFLAG
jgi:pimeloyl-ACP methyl ester carboxylesterase